MPDPASEIFTRIARLPPREREATLSREAAGDAALVSRVHAMLDAVTLVATSQSGTAAAPASNASRISDTVGPSTPVTSRSAAAAAAAASAPREDVGSMIGPYKILQEIGEGGFGFVYMAQQTAPIKRKVALKIVKPGMDTRQVIGRFEAERQALAMMDHANIAKVLDAGATPSGRPYFVMELVKGVPITEYCDTAQLTTDERLKLFMTVCHAVQHAHQKGIIHRDLKPSNVMVTLHDGVAVPKVIDFGISKAAGQDLTDKTVFTEYRHFIGTPAYMSPEQAAMSGLDVDTRSDIYSLGVLLYELLTGTTPLDAMRLKNVGHAEIQRIIQEDEPPPPSARVSQTGTAHTVSTGSGKSTTAQDIAKHRKTDLGTLRRKLSGDLDWIVMKALEKDRTRRYASCGDFSEDIEHYIADEPVHARPPSTGYRLRKFARRNRVGIVTGGAVMCALVLTLAVLGYSYAQVRHERDQTAKRATETRAQMLLSTMNSVRKYTTDRVRPAIVTAQGEHPELVKEIIPAFSARQVFENFRKDPAYATFAYKESSLNPTNANNRADEFEEKLLNDYRSGAISGDVQGVKQTSSGPVYYIARPMVIKDMRCLDCHTTPEMAPPKQIEMYGRDGGYGWKMNEVVAAQMVYVPVGAAFQTDPTATYWVVGSMIGVFMTVMAGIVVGLKRA
jgi:serine/threonine protein kinase